jgi:hypothetical protein
MPAALESQRLPDDLPAGVDPERIAVSGGAVRFS